uniref:Uncharacterized protein n=1 Tax=Eutreptiella gymnastica TaxID=73025 RepID=A0A7S4LDI9_9EUGL|mmetsp:Transcript_46067/g.75102  ORF Transcript_46067/g.75102 Transcript_46067/m.75102 type:complete len:160 (+) Transcript_46067:86-565(+)
MPHESEAAASAATQRQTKTIHAHAHAPPCGRPPWPKPSTPSQIPHATPRVCYAQLPPLTCCTALHCPEPSFCDPFPLEPALPRKRLVRRLYHPGALTAPLILHAACKTCCLVLVWWCWGVAWLLLDGAVVPWLSLRVLLEVAWVPRVFLQNDALELRGA